MNLKKAEFLVLFQIVDMMLKKAAKKFQVGNLKKRCKKQKALKGPKHDQIECGFFYINPTSMGW